MPNTEYVIKPLASIRLAARRAHVERQPDIAEVVETTFDELAEEIMAARGPGSLDVAIATYDTSEDGIDIVAGYGYDGVLPSAETVDLPACDQVVCAVHLGSMQEIGTSWQALATWIESQGWQPAGSRRESYLKAEPHGDQSQWVTELQQPVQRAK